MERMVEKVFEYASEHSIDAEGHSLESCGLAGFILDVVRCSVIVKTVQELEDGMERIESLNLEEHGLQVVRRKNGYSKEHDGGTGGFRDVKYLLLIYVPEVCNVQHIGEVQILLKPFLKVKKFMHLEYAIER